MADSTIKYEKLILAFHNELSATQADKIEDIPQERLNFIMGGGIGPLIEILVAQQLTKGKSRVQIGIYYGLSLSTVRAVGRRNGFYKS